MTIFEGFLSGLSLIGLPLIGVWLGHYLADVVAKIIYKS